VKLVIDTSFNLLVFGPPKEHRRDIKFVTKKNFITINPIRSTGDTLSIVTTSGARMSIKQENEKYNY